MRAIRIHGFGGIDTMRLDEIPRPVPGTGEVLVAVKAAGVGPWDQLVREGRSGLGQRLPLTLGSDVSGTVAALGTGAFALGDAVYGATNDRFVGGYVDVTRDRLDRISAMVERGTLNLPVGEVLDLADASTAHRMLDGASHKPGKIVLKVAD